MLRLYKIFPLWVLCEVEIYISSIIQDINGMNVNIDDCDAGWRWWIIIIHGTSRIQSLLNKIMYSL